MASSDDQFSIGQLIPGTPYRVRGLIGSGGMGSVYEVEHEELGKLFVLKALLPQLTERGDLAARMKNEWRALGRLQHPNIVVVTDAGRTSAHVPYYVMERLDGETLWARARRDGQLSLPLALRLCVGILDALAAAHALGIVHRDIKPQNVFLPASGGVKLLDFGVAKLKDQAAMVVTRQGVAIGTPKYMSPEQAEGKPVDGRADIYAVALVLFELLTGRGPFAHHRGPNDLVLAHLIETPARLDQVSAAVPEEVADLVQRWLAKSPADRPPDAAVAAREMRHILNRYGIEAAGAHDRTVSVAYDAATRGAEVPAQSAAAARPSEPRAPSSALRLRGGSVAPTPAVTRTVREGPRVQPAPRAPLGSQGSSGAEGSPGAELERSETPPPVIPAVGSPTAELCWSHWAGVAVAACALTFAALLAVVGGGQGGAFGAVRAASQAEPASASVARAAPEEAEPPHRAGRADADEVRQLDGTPKSGLSAKRAAERARPERARPERAGAPSSAPEAEAEASRSAPREPPLAGTQPPRVAAPSLGQPRAPRQPEPPALDEGLPSSGL